MLSGVRCFGRVPAGSRGRDVRRDCYEMCEEAVELVHRYRREDLIRQIDDWSGAANQTKKIRCRNRDPAFASSRRELVPRRPRRHV
jgi:hypothetical protein